jgi:hypothetical protein
MVDSREVTAVKPATRERGVRAFDVVVVPAQQLWRAMHDLAHRADRHVSSKLIHDPRLHIQHSTPRGPRLAQLLLRFQNRCDRRNLCLPIEVPEFHVGEALLQLAEYFDRHR